MTKQLCRHLTILYDKSGRDHSFGKLVWEDRQEMVYLSVSHVRVAIQAWVDLKDRGGRSYIYWIKNLQFEIMSKLRFFACTVF